MINRYVLSGLAFAGLLQPACAYDVNARLNLEPLIVKHAAANNVPPSLVHRIIIRESRYNPRAVGRGGAMGLMQIKHGTARALGYTGSPAGLLDAETNLTYAVRYLAGAYRVAGGDQNQAVGFYARGYYYDAKRKGMLGSLANRRAVAEEPEVVAAATPAPVQPLSPLATLFAPPRAAQPAQPALQAAVDEPEPPRPLRRSPRSGQRSAAALVTPAAQGNSAQSGTAPSEASQTIAVEGQSTVPVKPRRSAPRRAPVQAAVSAEGTSAQPTPTQTTTVEGRLPAPVQRSAARRSPPQAAVSTEVTSAQPASAQGATRPAVQGAEVLPPARPSGRSARPSASAGAGRSAQRVSAQPGDPEKYP